MRIGYQGFSVYFLVEKQTLIVPLRFRFRKLFALEKTTKKHARSFFVTIFFMPEIILGHFADQRRLSIFNLLCKASSLFENLIGKSILLTHKKQYCGNTFGCIQKKYDSEQKICKNHYTTKMFMKYVLCNICGGFWFSSWGEFFI